MTPVNVPPALAEVIAVATRLGVVDALVAVGRAVVKGRRADALRAAYRGAKAAAARLAIEKMR